MTQLGNPLQSDAEEVKRLAHEAQNSGDEGLENLGAAASVHGQISDIGLRREYAQKILKLMTWQVGIADAAFFIYGFSHRWEIDPWSMRVWLTSAVVQVIGVVAVITRSLFPNRGEGP